MELSVGDNVIHPRYGVGQITDIMHQELVEGYEHYYVLEIPEKRLTTHIPIRNMDEMGVRPVMRKAELKRVLDTLGDAPHRLPDDNKKRQKGLKEKIATGLPELVAEAVRDLTWHQHLEHLTKADSDLLARALNLLVAEMALVTNTDAIDANRKIEAVLNVAIAGNGKSKDVH